MFADPVEKRVDSDGIAYTEAEFLAHYGGRSEWEDAQVISVMRKPKQRRGRSRHTQRHDEVAADAGTQFESHDGGKFAVVVPGHRVANSLDEDTAGPLRVTYPPLWGRGTHGLEQRNTATVEALCREIETLFPADVKAARVSYKSHE